jgi:proteasome accessory factor C
MTERATAERRLQRLLLVLPSAARTAGGAPLDELAALVDASPREVLDDLEEAATRAFYHPAGSVDAFSILVHGRRDGARVRVHTGGEFTQPQRLTPRETLALALALRATAAEALPDRRNADVALARRLEAGLGSPPPDAASAAADRDAGRADAADAGADADEAGTCDIEMTIDDAMRRGLPCSISYIKPGASAPEPRTFEPWRLIAAAGCLYVIGRSVEANAVRVLRVDRIHEARVLDGPPFAVPADFDPAAFITPAGHVFASDADEPVTVRYEPPAARWVAEATGGTAGADGSITVRHAVADPRWIVRHVLGYGGAAVVHDPPGVRRAVRAAAERVARMHGG